MYLCVCVSMCILLSLTSNCHLKSVETVFHKRDHDKLNNSSRNMIH